MQFTISFRSDVVTMSCEAERRENMGKMSTQLSSVECDSNVRCGTVYSGIVSFRSFDEM